MKPEPMPVARQLKAISIRQPWASMIVLGFKPVENRTWKTNYRGPVLIHAAQKFDDHGWMDIRRRCFDLDPSHRLFDVLKDMVAYALPRGGIIGRAEVIDCVTSHPSPWFTGPYGHVMVDPQVMKFIPMRGELNYFDTGIFELPPVDFGIVGD